MQIYERRFSSQGIGIRMTVPRGLQNRVSAHPTLSLAVPSTPRLLTTRGLCVILPFLAVGSGAARRVELDQDLGIFSSWPAAPKIQVSSTESLTPPSSWYKQAFTNGLSRHQKWQDHEWLHNITLICPRVCCYD